MPDTELTIETLAAAPKLVQRQAVHALEAVRADSDRRRLLSGIVGSRRAGPYLGEIVPLVRAGEPDGTVIDRDVYAVEVVDPQHGITWTTVVHGATDRIHFGGENARWQAILHAGAQVAGGGDSVATASVYAARVLGFTIA